jgi:hypothetical protein
MALRLVSMRSHKLSLLVTSGQLLKFLNQRPSRFQGLRRVKSLLMEVNDLHPPDDYSHRFFIWHEWIQVPFLSEHAAQPPMHKS